MSTPMITSRQILAARESLGWTHCGLAGKAGLCEGTIERIEAGYGDFPYTLASLEAIRMALESAGIVVANDELVLR